MFVCTNAVKYVSNRSTWMHSVGPLSHFSSSVVHHVLTLSRVQVASMVALASSWQVRSKKTFGWTSDKGTLGSGGMIDSLAAQDRSSSTVRWSSCSKWKERLEVLGSTFSPTTPSNVTTEKPKVLTSMIESLKNFTYIEKKMNQLLQLLKSFHWIF